MKLYRVIDSSKAKEAKKRGLFFYMQKLAGSCTVTKGTCVSTQPGSWKNPTTVFLPVIQ